MKTVYKKFCCPQCGELRHINVNGVCYDCNNENALFSLAEKRKLQQKFEIVNHSIKIESYN